jgi:hypothetical protein
MAMLLQLPPLNNSKLPGLPRLISMAMLLQLPPLNNSKLPESIVISQLQCHHANVELAYLDYYLYGHAPTATVP